ncbi:MAG TPA: MFS transporter [Thermomicrobiales bacterium]|jgi:MFS family permease
MDHRQSVQPNDEATARQPRGEVAIGSVPALDGAPSAIATVETAPRAIVPTAPHRGPLMLVAHGGAVGLAWVGRKVLPIDHPLMRQEAFRTYWLSRLIGQAAQGMVLYALLVVIVDRTDDPFYGSLFVACSIVPSLLLGLPAGLVVDALPRRLLLVWLNVIRAAIVLLLVSPQPPLGLIFAVTLGLWTVHQFYNPAEGTTGALLVPEDDYADAQALANLALALAQLAGMVVAGPLFLRFASPSALFAFAAALFLAAGLLTAVLPSLGGRRQLAGPVAGESRFAEARRLVLAGWRTIKGDRVVLKAMTDDVLVGVGLSALVVIAPFYLVRVLGTSSANTVFVFAPAALGLVIGLRLAPAIGRAIGLQPAVSVSLVVFALCVGALGFVERIEAGLNNAGIPIDRVADWLRVPPLVLIVMLLSVPAGFASAVVGVSARAVLLARTPEPARGQVVATQNVFGNLGALVPTLLAGITADWLGVRAIAVAIGLVILGGAFAVTWATRERPAAEAIAT